MHRDQGHAQALFGMRGTSTKLPFPCQGCSAVHERAEWHNFPQHGLFQISEVILLYNSKLLPLITLSSFISRNVRLDAPTQFQGCSDKMGFVVVHVGGGEAVPGSASAGLGRGDFEEMVSQQGQAQVSAVLHTGLSWDTCWELRSSVWQPCLPQAEKNSLVQMQPQCPQAASALTEPPSPDVQVMVFTSSSPALQLLCKILLQL